MSLGKQMVGLIVWLVISFAAVSIGAIASAHARDFYQELARPLWSPPGSVFGPVWALLYTIMALSAWLVWREGGWHANRKALLIFLGQLSFNVLWSWLFFAWRFGAGAFIEIIVLCLLIAWTISQFWGRQRLAAVLLIPYFCWCSFAATLCFTIWQMNPELL